MDELDLMDLMDLMFLKSTNYFCENKSGSRKAI